MAVTEGPSPGGRRFLPLPILASAFFIVLAVGGQLQGTTHTQYGDFPTVAGLWADMKAGEFQVGDFPVAYDKVLQIYMIGNTYTVRFASLPQVSFSSDSEYTNLDAIADGDRVYAFFGYSESSVPPELWLEFIVAA